MNWKQTESGWTNDCWVITQTINGTWSAKYLHGPWSTGSVAFTESVEMDKAENMMMHIDLNMEAKPT
jgi:hypothetical protein